MEIGESVLHGNLRIGKVPRINDGILAKKEPKFSKLYKQYSQLSDNYIPKLPVSKANQEDARRFNELFKERIVKIAKKDEKLACEFLKYKIQKIKSVDSIEPERRMDELYYSLWKLGAVDKKVIRGSQPSELDLKWLKSFGIYRVINLRQEDLYLEKNDKNEERKACIKHGLDYKEFPLLDRESNPPTKEMIQKVVDCIKASRGRVFVHCAGGMGRTGMVVAAYRMQVCGVSLKEALAEAEEYAFIPEMRPNQVKVLKEFEVNPLELYLVA